MTVYYKTTEGTIIRNCNLEEAYLITTGKHRFESENDWMCWLNSIWGKYIISAHNVNEFSVEEYVRNGNKLEAVRLYRDQHNCTLREAKDVVDEMFEEANGNVSL